MVSDSSRKLTPDKTTVILDSVADGVFTVDGKFRITSFNRSAEEITGIPREEAIGRPCCEVFRADICETACALKSTGATGKPVINRSVSIIRSDGTRVPISVSSAILKDESGKIIGGVETFRDLSLVEELRKEVEEKYTFADIISRNRLMREIFAILPEVAESNSTVLIAGATGTGKELFARAIHNLSSRRRKKMVAVNCGAIPDTLLESELFGYVAGAFTDAKKDKPGRFAVAEGGTLFLDEIGDVSSALQVRLLRLLQEKTYEPLGSNRTQNADVRIIAATNRDLKKGVAEGWFREDLYYRVNVIKIDLPPLKERMEDIPLLARHFIEKFNRIQGKEILGLSQEAMSVFMEYDWPGNIRELENAVERAFILCRGGLIEPGHLPREWATHVPAKGSGLSTGNTLAEHEARIIYEALVRNNWNRAATARELGIGKSTLWRKIKRLELDIPDTQE